MRYASINIKYMLTSSGSDPNKPCVFPFIYMKETINTCTTIDGDHEVC